MFLKTALQEQKILSRIILKGTAAHLSNSFVNQYKNMSNVNFTALSTRKNNFFTEHPPMTDFVLYPKTITSKNSVCLKFLNLSTFVNETNSFLKLTCYF